MSLEAANIVIYVLMAVAVLAAMAHLINPSKGDDGSDQGGSDEI